MLTLYQREGCPACRLVRRTLTDLGQTFRAVNVPKLGSERKKLLALPEIEKPEVPVLVDEATVVQGGERIVAYLRERAPEGSFGDPSYGLTRVLPDTGFRQAGAAPTAALAT